MRLSLSLSTLSLSLSFPPLGLSTSRFALANICHFWEACCTELCKNIPSRLREWLAEILHHSAFLGWVAEHFEVGSRNVPGMFLHNSVVGGVGLTTEGGSRRASVCLVWRRPWPWSVLNHWPSYRNKCSRGWKCDIAVNAPRIAGFHLRLSTLIWGTTCVQSRIL